MGLGVLSAGCFCVFRMTTKQPALCFSRIRLLNRVKYLQFHQAAQNIQLGEQVALFHMRQIVVVADDECGAEIKHFIIRQCTEFFHGTLEQRAVFMVCPVKIFRFL